MPMREHFGKDNNEATAGSSKSKLLSANTWITDMANFAEMNAVWDAWVAPGNTPEGHYAVQQIT